MCALSGGGGWTYIGWRDSATYSLIARGPRWVVRGNTASAKWCTYTLALSERNDVQYQKSHAITCEYDYIEGGRQTTVGDDTATVATERSTAAHVTTGHSWRLTADMEGHVAQLPWQHFCIIKLLIMVSHSLVYLVLQISIFTLWFLLCYIFFVDYPWVLK